jgi:RsiW-degrading membrane proteinase PrsW (M82 family)
MAINIQTVYMPEIAGLSNKLLLVCIAGRDEHHRIAVGEDPVKIGNRALQPDFAIAELTPSEGYILVGKESETLRLDAGNCSMPLYINNEPTHSGSLQGHDILRIGNSIWRIQQAGGKLSPGLFNEKFSTLIGLEELQDFRLGDIFSEVFKKHTAEEMEEQLITGTVRHTPVLDDIEIGWARPWLFARLLAGSVALAFILYEGFQLFNNINLVPGLIFIGSFAVPVSTLLFFLEMNVPRNVSIFKVMQLLFVGGVASLIVALVFFSRFDFFSTFLGASAAGIIEESAKLLIVAMLMGKTRRYRWILNGLLFGAAIGTGFGAFESAGYAFRAMLDSGVDQGVGNIMLRGLLAPFTHIVWTANAAAALWLVKGDKAFSWEMLKAPAFLRIFVSMMLIHMAWNAPFELLRLPLVLDLKFLLLGLLAWIICFRLVQAGLKQLNKARQKPVPG